jgi:CheY-like chemotaxis protein
MHKENNLTKPEKTRARVLVVDDDELWAPLLTYKLEAAGFHVVTDMDPRDALARFHRNPDCVDVVVTDLSMPYLTGSELAHRLWDMRPSLHIVGTTGNLASVPDEARMRFGMLVAKDEAPEKIPAHLKRHFPQRRYLPSRNGADDIRA